MEEMTLEMKVERNRLLRESVKQINKLNMPKQELMQMLNALGFGQREQITPS